MAFSTVPRARLEASLLLGAGVLRLKMVPGFPSYLVALGMLPSFPQEWGRDQNKERRLPYYF